MLFHTPPPQTVPAPAKPVHHEGARQLADEGEGSALPQLYSEEQIWLPDSPPLSDGEHDGVLAALLRAGSAKAREQVVRQRLHALGFEWLAYGTVAVQGGRSKALSFFTSYANKDWVLRYFSERYHQVDSRHQSAPTSSLPLMWDADSLWKAVPDGRGTLLHRRFLEDFFASGIRSGIFFRVASPMRPGQHAVISLMSSAPQRAWIDETLAGEALMLGLNVHEYLSRYARLSAAQPHALARISQTQQCILEHLRQGRSDKEIANLLNLSPHAVDYHMRQLRRHFEARNRVQLVNFASAI